MIYVRGANSAIAQSLAELHTISPVSRGALMPDDGERYFFCQGVLLSDAAFDVNAWQVIRECDRLLELNPKARICVMGSESAFTWSHDSEYAAAKAALHRYVETKKLLYPEQQLVCVAPSIVVGTNMTNSRNEQGIAAMRVRQDRHPKGRWLEPIEVARMVFFLLCVDAGYTTGVVIRMNGGEHCVSR